jgi:NAD(P)-dependent dehydrogenase (short-subunit alcohol dehydrogenase family)
MNILITGATGNLGQAVVSKLSNHNLIVITSPGKSSGFEKSASMFEADLIDEVSVQSTVNAILAKHKTIDAALLLVGAFTFGGIDKADGASIKKMFDVNFNTAYFVARPVFQQMVKQQGGRIILIGARAALDAKSGRQNVAYALSKSLIFTLAELLNAEGADKNIVTSVFVPSTIDTPANRSAMPSADFSKWVQPEEIADLIDVVVSEKSKALREPIIKVYGNV